MSAESALYALLAGAAPVTALVASRIYPVVVPEGQPLPAITFELISSMRLDRIDAQAATHPTRSRVQVNLLARDYAAVKALRSAVKAACQFQRGAIGGSAVISVMFESEGADGYDQLLDVFHQSVDFLITHCE